MRDRAEILMDGTRKHFTGALVPRGMEKQLLLIVELLVDIRDILDQHPKEKKNEK